MKELTKNKDIDLTGFVPLNDHPNYMIHPDGRVYSIPRTLSTGEKCSYEYSGCMLKNSLCSDGTYTNSLGILSRLLAIQFISNPNNHEIVSHKNGIKSDDRLSNLKWVSIQKSIEVVHAKHFRLKDPHGEEIKIYNLRKFSRDNNLSNGTLHDVMDGSRNHHKGYTKSEDTSAMPLFN